MNFQADFFKALYLRWDLRLVPKPISQKRSGAASLAEEGHETSMLLGLSNILGNMLKPLAVCVGV